jgi:hypothetical protein
MPGAIPPTMCGTNEYLKGVNFVNSEVVCAAIPSCASGKALSWTGSSFTCVDAPTYSYVDAKFTAAVAAAVAAIGTSTGSTPTELYWRTQGEWLDVDLPYPQCVATANIAGSTCSVLNDRCKSSFCAGPSGVDMGIEPNCIYRRLFKCVP